MRKSFGSMVISTSSVSREIPRPQRPRYGCDLATPVTGTRCTRCTPVRTSAGRTACRRSRSDLGFDRYRRVLHPAQVGLLHVDDLHAPAPGLRVAVVHAHQITGEQRGFIPPSPALISRIASGVVEGRAARATGSGVQRLPRVVMRAVRLPAQTQGRLRRVHGRPSSSPSVSHCSYNSTTGRNWA